VKVLLVNLIYQVSDKGLLERCGTENGYLNEVRTVQPDLRVCASGEPESEPKGPSPGCSVNRWNRKRSFRDWVTGLQRTEGFGPEVTWKVTKTLRGWCSIRRNDASSRNSASAEERTAGRWCHNKQYRKAQGCRIIS